MALTANDLLACVITTGLCMGRLDTLSVDDPPDEKLQILRSLTVRRAQMVDARKRLSAQIFARRKQDASAELEDMDSSLKALL